jgi:4-aminobutyrate aminotransferase-like enzyme
VPRELEAEWELYIKPHVKEFSLTPKRVDRVETSFRGSSPISRRRIIPICRSSTPQSRSRCGQPPIVWDHAEGFQVYDAWGNCWIDWSSGVLITNAGHGRKEIIDAITRQVSSKLLTNYCFPSEIRARLVERLSGLLPEPLKKVFLLTTGSETVECAIKLCRSHGLKAGGRSKHVVISYDKAFHGPDRSRAGVSVAEGMDRQPRCGLRADCSPMASHRRTRRSSFSSAACASAAWSRRT